MLVKGAPGHHIHITDREIREIWTAKRWTIVLLYLLFIHLTISPTLQSLIFATNSLLSPFRTDTQNGNISRGLFHQLISFLEKMAAVLTDDIFKWILFNENGRILIQISHKVVPMCPIDNKPALVLVMAWCRTGDKPLSEPMMPKFTDAYMRHKGEMSWYQHI